MQEDPDHGRHRRRPPGSPGRTCSGTRPRPIRRAASAGNSGAEVLGRGEHDADEVLRCRSRCAAGSATGAARSMRAATSPSSDGTRIAPRAARSLIGHLSSLVAVGAAPRGSQGYPSTTLPERDHLVVGELAPLPRREPSQPHRPHRARGRAGPPATRPRRAGGGPPVCGPPSSRGGRRPRSPDRPATRALAALAWPSSSSTPVRSSPRCFGVGTPSTSARYSFSTPNRGCVRPLARSPSFVRRRSPSVSRSSRPTGKTRGPSGGR